MQKLLLTAFEPFGGESVNASLEAVRRAGEIRVPDAEILTHVLPVARFRGPEIAADLVRSVGPDVILMTGQDGGRPRVSPERVAINLDDFSIPDNEGHQPREEPILEGGPTAYFSTLPLRAMTERMTAAGIPVAISNSAGMHLCNRLFYLVRHLVETEGLPVRAGFLHLPRLEEQAEKGFPLETLVTAVRLAIETSLQEGGCRDQPG
jgi:pyroglutamyl-peptidase